MTRLIAALIAIVAANLAAPAAAQESCAAARGAAIAAPAWRSTAEEAGLDEIDAFVGVIAALEAAGRPPGCYLTKSEARRAGWRPGRSLWATSPGAAIGGGVFQNREGRLSACADRRCRILDLDYAGQRSRGPKRLIYRVDGDRVRAWITPDHYESFAAVHIP